MDPSPRSTPDAWSPADFAPIAEFLRSQIGLNLEPHRLGLLQARLRSRLQARSYPGFTRFFERVLSADPNGPGRQLLIDLSTVNHTAFFREPAHFTFLVERVAKLCRETTNGPIRIWSAGCSSGQEPYSMAMALSETIPPGPLQRVEICATDLSLEVLRAAAAAIYTEREMGGISPGRLKRFFLRGKGLKAGQYRVVPEIRALVQFRHLDLRVSSWPLPEDFHAIFCRNVSIYFASDERARLLNGLASHLRVGGWLAIGNGEILASIPSVLKKIDPAIYRKEADSS